MLNLDTHVFLYAVAGRLKKKEQEALSENRWSISAIVLWEVTKLAQLGRIELDLNDPEVLRVLSRVRTWPIDLDVCRAIPTLDFSGDPADEIIAATSVVHDIPLITRDRKIRRSRRVPLFR